MVQKMKCMKIYLHMLHGCVSRLLQSRKKTGLYMVNNAFQSYKPKKIGKSFCTGTSWKEQFIILCYASTIANGSVN